jgi:hypothetical protein
MKVYVRCNGGLGNQLFQYALGRALSIKTGAMLVLDDWRGRRGISRPFELQRFKIEGRLPNAAETILCRLVDSTRPSLRRISSAMRTITPGILPAVIYERRRGFDPDILALSRTAYLSGWWQSERFFLDHQNLLRAELTLRDSPNAENQQCLDRIRSSEAVCIHVRRGDYTGPKNAKKFGVCDPEYYARGIEFISQRIASPVFYVFSDDPAWSRQNLNIPQPNEFVTHNCGISDWEDMRLMSACRHFIIANSTFSWWGAWLSTSPNKSVITPKRWYSDPNLSNDDLIPPSWISI